VLSSEAIIAGVVVVSVAIPVATLLGWLPVPKSTSSPAPRHAPPPRHGPSPWHASSPAQANGPKWRLSRKVGNVFQLTNIGVTAVSDVVVLPKDSSLDIRPRGAPWRQLDVGESVEFVALPQADSACTLTISWTTPDGSAKAAEADISPPRG